MQQKLSDEKALMIKDDEGSDVIVMVHNVYDSQFPLLMIVADQFQINITLDQARAMVKKIGEIEKVEMEGLQ